jgi:hypothetical protein
MKLNANIHTIQSVTIISSCAYPEEWGKENRTERTFEPRANVVVVTISMASGIEAISTTTAKDSDSVRERDRGGGGGAERER